MVNHQERWDLVGEAIARRIEDLGLTKAEVIRTSGVSAKTLDGYLAGEPIVRPDKRRGISDALGWTRDSIARVLAGDEPLEIGQVAPSTGAQEAWTAVQDELAALRKQVEALRQEVAKQRR